MYFIPFFPKIRTINQVPKEEEGAEVSRRQAQTSRGRPLYDIPYMWEAREFMRKKLIGKKVYMQL